MKFVSILALALFTLNSHSAEQCASWGCVSTIEELYTNAVGNIYVSTPLDETGANCTVYPGNYFILPPDQQNTDKVYSQILAAYISQSKIQLRITEGDGYCKIKYVRQSAVF